MSEYLIELIKEINIEIENLHQLYSIELDNQCRFSELGKIHKKQRELFIVREYLENKLMK